MWFFRLLNPASTPKISSPTSFFPFHNQFICRSEAKAWYLNLTSNRRSRTRICSGIEFGMEAGLEIKNKKFQFRNSKFEIRN